MSKSRETKTVKFRCGAHTIILRPIPKTYLGAALAETGKPVPPKKEVEYMGGVKRLEDDLENPEYVGAHNLWYAGYADRLMRVCLAFGVEEVQGPPPTAEEQARIRAAFGKDITPQEEFVFWCFGLIGDETQGFLNLALGQGEITEEGLKEAEDRFQPSSERAGADGADN